ACIEFMFRAPLKGLPLCERWMTVRGQGFQHTGAIWEQQGVPHIEENESAFRHETILTKRQHPCAICFGRVNTRAKSCNISYIQIDPCQLAFWDCSGCRYRLWCRSCRTSPVVHGQPLRSTHWRARMLPSCLVSRLRCCIVDRGGRTSTTFFGRSYSALPH